MPKVFLSVLILGFWGLVITPVRAEDTQISNTVHSSAIGSNANSNVSITNNVGSSNNSSSSSNCTTNVVIDSNGEHKEYHGDCGNIDIQSGSNSVKISNQAVIAPTKTPSPNVLSVATSQPSPTASPSPIPLATPSASPSANNSQFNLLNFVKQELENILSIFRH